MRRVLGAEVNHVVIDEADEPETRAENAFHLGVPACFFDDAEQAAAILADPARAAAVAAAARRTIEAQYDMTANSRDRAELFARFLEQGGGAR